MGIAVDYKGTSVLPGAGDGEGAVAGGEVEDVDGGRWAVGLAGLAVVAGFLQSEETVGGVATGASSRSMTMKRPPSLAATTAVVPLPQTGSRTISLTPRTSPSPRPAGTASPLYRASSPWWSALGQLEGSNKKPPASMAGGVRARSYARIASLRRIRMRVGLPSG